MKTAVNRIALALLIGGVVFVLLVLKADASRPTPLSTLTVRQQTFLPVEHQEYHWNFTGCQHDPDDFRFASGSGIVAGAATVWAGCVNADWQEHLVSVTACSYRPVSALTISLNPDNGKVRIPYATGAYQDGRRLCRWACMGTGDYDRSYPFPVVQNDPLLVGVRTDIYVTVTADTGNRGLGLSANIVPRFRTPDGELAYCRRQF